MSRNLDAALAKLLGYKVEYAGLHENPIESMPYINNNKDNPLVPFYSTDGRAMLLLDEEMRKRNYYLENVCFETIKTIGYGWMAEYRDDTGLLGMAKGEETEAIARAIAAYHALKGGEMKNEKK